MAKDTAPATELKEPLDKAEATDTPTEMKAALDKIESLEMQVSELQAQRDALESECKLLLEENDALKNEVYVLRQEEIATSSAKVMPRGAAAPVLGGLPTFVVDGVEYQFKVHAFRVAGQRLTTAEAAKDESACRMILEKFPSLVQTI